MLVVYPDWYIIDENGQKIGHRATPEYDYLRMLKRHYCIPGPGVFFRRSVAERLKGRDEGFRYVADFDFWLRAGLSGPFARIPKTLATFRWHSGGASSKDQGTAMAQEHVRLIEKIFSMPNLPQAVLEAKREAFSNAYYEAAVALGAQALDLKRDYYRRAVALYPWKYLSHEKLSLAESLILMMLGDHAYLTARRSWDRLKAARARRRGSVLSCDGQETLAGTKKISHYGGSIESTRRWRNRLRRGSGDGHLLRHESSGPGIRCPAV